MWHPVKRHILTSCIPSQGDPKYDPRIYRLHGSTDGLTWDLLASSHAQDKHACTEPSNQRPITEAHMISEFPVVPIALLHHIMCKILTPCVPNRSATPTSSFLLARGRVCGNIFWWLLRTESTDWVYFCQESVRWAVHTICRIRHPINILTSYIHPVAIWAPVKGDAPVQCLAWGVLIGALLKGVALISLVTNGRGLPFGPLTVRDAERLWLRV